MPCAKGRVRPAGRIAATVACLLVVVFARHGGAQQAPLSEVLSFLLTNRGVQTGDF